MELKVGMTFRNLEKTKCVVVNIFNDGPYEVVTYKYWVRRKRQWIFKTDYTHLFLIAFEYGWKWQ